MFLSLSLSLRGDGNPLHYSCLENPMKGGAWWAAVHGVEKNWTRLSDFTFTFHFHAVGEGNGSPPQGSCLENPREDGAWWAAVYGVTQSQKQLKRQLKQQPQQPSLLLFFLYMGLVINVVQGCAYMYVLCL